MNQRELDDVSDMLTMASLDAVLEPEVDDLVDKAHWGHPGRKGLRGGSQPHSAASMFRGSLRRFQGRHRAAERATARALAAMGLKAGSEPDPWVSEVVARFRGQWAAATAGVETASAAVSAWRSELPSLRIEVLRQLTGNGANEPLQQVAEGLFDTFIGDLDQRRIQPAITDSLDPARTVQAVPGMLQGALAWVATRVRAFEQMRTLATAKAEIAADLIPEGIDREQRYRWVTAADLGVEGDVPVCAVCEHMSELEGTFRVADALKQFDDFMNAMDDGTLDDTVERVPIPRIDDVEDLGVRALTAMGLLVPPIHPNCRCGIIFV